MYNLGVVSLALCRPRGAVPRRGVAQPGRAPGSGPGGRRFESCLPDQSADSIGDLATRSACSRMTRCPARPAHHLIRHDSRYAAALPAAAGALALATIAAVAALDIRPGASTRRGLAPAL